MGGVGGGIKLRHGLAAEPDVFIGDCRSSAATGFVAVNVAERVMPAKVAVMSVDFGCLASVTMSKTAVVAPPGTVTLDGAVTKFFGLVVIVTAMPPAGAAPLIVTVACEIAPA